jgi:hypothetical protein
LLALIIGCEIAFWVVLGAGLIARYVAKAPRLGLALLVCVPLVDLVLLIATVIDLRAGATAEWAHGLAALYLGFSVAYGHQMITWADGWAAYFWGSGPRPSKRYGREHSIWALKNIGRVVLAGVIAVALLALAVWYVDDPQRTAGLTQWFGSVAIVVAIVVIIDVSDVLWPRKPKPARRA